MNVEAGDGGSAGVVISNAIRSFKHIDYDKRYIVLDSDLPPTSAEYKKALKEKYTIILWSPMCLEGMLLDTLKQKVNKTETSQHLKKRLQPQLSGPHTDAKSYAKLFTKQCVIDSSNQSLIDVLQAITENAQ